ncbi:hypothetical protein R0G64_31685, partial [Pseudomonas otitidis]
PIAYDLLIDGQGIAEWAPHLLYGEATRPDFVLRSRIEPPGCRACVAYVWRPPLQASARIRSAPFSATIITA